MDSPVSNDKFRLNETLSYDPTQREGECPDEDAITLLNIEVEFAIPTTMTQEQQERLFKVIQEIVESPWNQLKGKDHYISSVGCKIWMSRIDAALIGGRAWERVDPTIKNGEEPTHDNSVLFFETKLIKMSLSSTPKEES